ncbi:YtxH domain-containing protein [Jeotgalibacillus sp. ET6]|uniref:YtxH domain-containing protein n=1 Tax=Jeotgalibacillus sp. ET6 TaxID=3037260 RepID=UPI0024185BD7|nr:YtxH domain-containing protein [Jeotgalibacillus sp. ET6]MDG5471896.1 YtxH domain-containing protein [Jeotgalibacillus sp. ET6]
MAQTQQYNTTSTNTEEKNSKLLKGVLIGAVIGGAVTMLDSTTRKSVASGGRGVKDSTVGLVTKVKDNPSEIKHDLQDRLKSAASVLKNAMSDAQSLYERVNEDVLPQVDEIRESASDIVSTAKETTEGVKDIGSQVAEAGSEVTGDSNDSLSSSSTNSASSNQNRSANSQSGSANTGSSAGTGTATLNPKSADTVAASPKGDIPGNRTRRK